MRPVLRPVLLPAAKYAVGRSTQIAASRLHSFHVCLRAIAFMFIYTQHASKIAGNFVALLVETQRKLKYVQLGAACGLRPTVCALRQSMNLP